MLPAPVQHSRLCYFTVSGVHDFELFITVMDRTLHSILIRYNDLTPIYHIHGFAIFLLHYNLIGRFSGFGSFFLPCNLISLICVSFTALVRQVWSPSNRSGIKLSLKLRTREEINTFRLNVSLQNFVAERKSCKLLQWQIE